MKIGIGRGTGIGGLANAGSWKNNPAEATMIAPTATLRNRFTSTVDPPSMCLVRFEFFADR
jgi:hypothetical protein